LLAVADGEIVHKGTGGQLVGNYIWLHYAPDATGLPVHLFARYQHLDAVPGLEVGAKVKAGDSVARSGNTGTAGGHFGSAGYNHLHLLFLTHDSADYTIKGPMVGPKSMNYLDPVALYLKPAPVAANAAARDLPRERKRVAIPVMTASRTFVPAGTRVVWPVACTAK
jgi:murein DD-endopeptidase MepM/ murein hydrolase activator NlpD